MFSSISSYIFGGEEAQTPQTQVEEARAPRDHSAEGEDWVLVGDAPGPAPGDLGAALPALPALPSGASSPSGSSTSSNNGDAEPMEDSVPVAARHRAHHPTALAQQAAKKEFQHVKSAQITKQKTSGKAMSSKALNRTNKAVFASTTKKYATRQSFNLKMAGSNKNLKQCWKVGSFNAI